MGKLLHWVCTNVILHCCECAFLFARKNSYSWFQTFAMFWMLYAFFWVIPQRLNFICRRFGTLCSTFIGAYDDGTECSETSAYNIQRPGNYPEESRQQEHSCLKRKCWVNIKRMEEEIGGQVRIILESPTA